MAAGVNPKWEHKSQRKLGATMHKQLTVTRMGVLELTVRNIRGNKGITNGIRVERISKGYWIEPGIDEATAMGYMK